MVGRVGRTFAMVAGPTLATTLAGAAMPAAAKPWASGTYIYSDLCVERGERAGRRIILRRSPNGDVLTYEAATQSQPVAVRDVALEEGTKTMSFAVETEAGTVAFEGRIETEALTGTIEDATGTHALRLRRVLRSGADRPCSGETTGSVDGPRR